MESARDHVFRLPELLEIILSYLPQKDLLLSQSVSRRFRATITESSKLQRLLFLLPDWRLTTNATRPRSCPLPAQPTNNRLILRAFPGCYPTVSLVISDNNNNNTTPTSQQSTFSTTTTARTWDVCIAFPASSPSSPPPLTHAAVAYPEASWRRMYLCQPPAKRLHLVRRWQRSAKPAIVRDEGITMGQFFEEAVSGGRREAGWERRFVGLDLDWHFEGRIEDC